MTYAASTSIGPAAQRLVRIDQAADVGEARRQAADIAAMLGFDATAAGALALGVTEAGMNIVKHARDGCILARALPRDPGSAIEVLALDRGPGMSNLAQCMRDGYSTAGSPGTGLGALRRMTGELQIVSTPGKGTALRFEVQGNAAHRSNEPLAVGAVCVPKAGETACGDAWALVGERGMQTLLVVDGLGHGVDAAAAANVAVDFVLRAGHGPEATELMARLHQAMRATRGAAAAAIVLDRARQSGEICGIGNIAATVRHAGTTRKLVSHNGIVGHQSRKLQAFPFAFEPGSLLIVHSDGLDTRWRLEDYPGLENAHPALIAGVLYRDHQRGRDDATVVVVRGDSGDGA